MGDFKGGERRHHERFVKNFIMKYYVVGLALDTHEITQLKNLSLGGMCFITSQIIEMSADVCVELNTPYITDITYLRGSVLGSQQKLKDMLYETRIQFKDLNEESLFVLEKLVKIFQKQAR